MSDFDFKMISDGARDLLLSDPYFSALVVNGLNVPFIISEDPQDIANAVQKALSDVNIAVVVLLPILRNNNPNESGPYFDNVTFHVKVYEMPNVNRPRGGPNAYQLAVNVCRVLHHGTPDSYDDMFFVTDAIPVADPDLLCYQIGIKCSAGFQYSGNSVATQIASVVAAPITPSLSPQAVTLACATPGAAIYYTSDDTYPSPLNATSTIYSAPLTINPGQKLRARAWLSGYSPATPPEIEIPY